MSLLIRRSASLLGATPTEALGTSVMAVALGTVGGYSARLFELPIVVALAVAGVLATAGLLLRLAQYRRRDGGFARAVALQSLGPRLALLILVHAALAALVTLFAEGVLGPAA